MPKRANPVNPNDGIKWFRKRVPLKKAAWLKLDARAQAKAFTIARVAKLSVVADVHEKLTAAIKRGDSFEDFKKKVGEQLTKAWGEDRPWHIETIFRNGTQRAYSAGRREQMTQPAIIRERPYWVMTPLLDSRTTEICRGLRGKVVLPAEHRFWATHWPPLHHNCRTLVYGVTSQAAKRLGITTRVPTTQAAPGFGHSDPLQWQPDLSLYPPELVKVYREGE